MRKYLIPLSGALLVVLAGCSETTQTAEKKAPEKLEPLTGQTALYKMFQVARSWAGPDTEVLKMTSGFLSQASDVPRGKAALWQATFTSASRGQARSYTYSIVEDLPANLHRAVFAGLEEGWSGSSGVNTPFLIAAVKVDTDAAYQTALGQAADYEKKSPGKPISLLLEKNQKFPDPVWRVIWGESVGTSNFSIFVDASTGLFLEKMH